MPAWDRAGAGGLEAGDWPRLRVCACVRACVAVNQHAQPPRVPPHPTPVVHLFMALCKAPEGSDIVRRGNSHWVSEALWALAQEAVWVPFSDGDNDCQTIADI